MAPRRAVDVFPVPAYLPDATRAVLPFARRYCARAARSYGVPLADCWDEALTALLRASLHFRPGAGTFHAYARTAIVRGLWRYCRRPVSGRPALGLDAVPPATLPDVETLLIAFEAAAILTPTAAHTATPPVAHRAPR